MLRSLPEPGGSPTRRGLLAAGVALLAACAGSSGHEPAPSTPQAAQAPLWIDTRLPAPFAEGHVPGALNLQWDWEQLADRVAAYVPDPSRTLYLRSTDEAEQRAALELLRAAGYQDVSAPPPPPETETLALMRADELAESLAGDEEFVLIDVRSRAEHLTGTIDAAMLVDPDEAATMLDRLDPSRRYYIICEGGYRSSQLASWMRLHGFDDVHNVIDGMWAWRQR